MDFQVSVPGPFTYLVHEHARSIVAIQELQEEVTSLLEFRENVLAALPHLHARPCPSLAPHDASTSRPAHRAHASPSKAAPHVIEGGAGQQQRGGAGANSSGSSGGSKSLSEAHNSAVADSGFSTDKAGGSMGKSSSSSAAEHLSGSEDVRWTSVEPDLPLGSAEDELWQLLDVIQRKGTRLRHDLDHAERMERDRLVHPASSTTPSPASDPLTSPHPHPVYRDAWPHSLPGPLGHYPSRTHLLPPPPIPPPMGVALEAEAWAAVERLRQDRQYLAGRVSWAEAEAAASHQRLLDLHTQLLALAGDKRRLEDQVRALCLHPGLGPDFGPGPGPTPDDRSSSKVDPRSDVNLQFMKTNGVRGEGGAMAGGIIHSVMGGVNTVHIVTDHTTTTTPTLATAGKPRRSAPTVTVSVGGGDGAAEDLQGGRGVVRAARSASSVRVNSERDREVILPRVLKVPIRDRTPRTKDRDQSDSTKGPGDDQGGSGGQRGSDRVVIERERRPGRADGGWSMPVSLLKGGEKVKVAPNKQRISAILREKDVIELQRQLLTTVMETEVLRKQVEAAGEEWESRTGEWEVQHRTAQTTITALRDQNQALRTQLDSRVGSGGVGHREVGVSVRPSVTTTGTMTEGGGLGAGEEEASHRVHPGPNIKYDVVIHQDPPRQDHPTRKVGLAGVEKPPRRTREVRGAPSSTTHTAHRDSPTAETPGGRDSLGRGAGSRFRPSLSHSGRGTPTGTPRSSPAASMTTRLCGSRSTPQEGGRATPLGRNSSSGPSGRSILGRRDSIKVAQAASPAKASVKTSSSGGQNKGSPTWSSEQGSVCSRAGSVTKGRPSPPMASLDCTASPLALSDLCSSSPDPSSCSPVPSSAFPLTSHPSSPLTSSQLVSSSLSSHLASYPLTSSQLLSPPLPSSPNISTLIPRVQERRGSAGGVRSYTSEAGAKRNLRFARNGNEYMTPKTSGQLRESGHLQSDIGQLEEAHYIKNMGCLRSELEKLQDESGPKNIQRESESPGVSLSSASASCSSFYDSINTEDVNKLMQVEVTFEWSPVPAPDIRYLPPAAHDWTPTHRTLCSGKRLPPVTPVPAWSAAAKVPNVGHRASMRAPPNMSWGESSYQGVDSGDDTQHWPADSLEDEDRQEQEATGRRRARLRAKNGAVRVKSVDRPSVLSMVQEVPSNPHPGSGPQELTGSPISHPHHRVPLGRSSEPDTSQRLQFRHRRPQGLREPGASSALSSDADLNSRVHQILARIAASAQ